MPISGFVRPSKDFDAFLKIDGVDGEAQDDKHKDWIEVHDFSWGCTNAGTGGKGIGSGTSKVRVGDLAIEKLVDKSSPALMLHCCNGKHFDSAKLVVRKAGGENPVEFYKITLTEAFVSSVQTGLEDVSVSTEAQEKEDWAAGHAKEFITLNFSKIEWEYTAQNKDGSPGASIKKWYDVKANKQG